MTDRERQSTCYSVDKMTDRRIPLLYLPTVVRW